MGGWGVKFFFLKTLRVIFSGINHTFFYSPFYIQSLIFDPTQLDSSYVLRPANILNFCSPQRCKTIRPCSVSIPPISHAVLRPPTTFFSDRSKTPLRKTCIVSRGYHIWQILLRFRRV